MGDGRTDERTDGQKFPLCSTGLRPLRGRCPKGRRQGRRKRGRKITRYKYSKGKESQEEEEEEEEKAEGGEANTEKVKETPNPRSRLSLIKTNGHGP